MNDALREALEGQRIDTGSLTRSRRSSAVLTTVIRGGDVAVGAWLALRDAYEHTGYWPILRGDALGDGDDDASDDDPNSILTRVPSGTVEEIMAHVRDEERRQMIDWYRQQGQEPPNLLADPSEQEEQERTEAALDDEDEPWPLAPLRLEFAPTSAFDILSNKPLERCGLALVRTPDPSACAAYLGFGGWNACPPPDVHVAVMRNWASRYGAVPAAITNDVVEMHVDLPPKTEDEAMALAAEQFAYCDDIVSQGTQTLRRLAIEIWRSPQWYFWWD